MYVYTCHTKQTEVLTAVIVESMVFCQVIECSSDTERFGETYLLHLQCRKISPAYSSFPLITVGFFAGLLFDTKDGGDTNLRNVGFSQNYKALYPTRAAAHQLRQAKHQDMRQ